MNKWKSFAGSAGIAAGVVVVSLAAFSFVMPKIKSSHEMSGEEAFRIVNAA